jgi:2',3'-cyclic-nucleotide 2'-phosphodiesterase (5'-nucleotidase family)
VIGLRRLAPLAVALALVAGCGGGAGEAPRALEGAAAGLVPPDEGAQLVLFVGSELFGSIDGCGCMGNPQLGGLPYRAAFVEGLRAAWPGVATLELDAGSSMAAIKNPSGKVVPDFEVQNEWVVTAFDRLGFDAANLTDHDAPFLARYLARDAAERAAAERPVLARFVSANLEPARPDLVAPPPYVVRTVAGERLPGGSLRVAVAGATRRNPALEAEAGFRTTDAAAALERALPRARAESDLVVVLAHMPASEGEALAARLGPLADVVVVASSLSGDRAPSLDGPVRVVYSWYKTQQLGVLALHLDGTRIRSAAWTYVKLDDPLPRAPRADETVVEAKEAVRRVRDARRAAASG